MLKKTLFALFVLLAIISIVEAQPDLILKDLTLKDDYQIGQYVKFSVVFENIGTAESGFVDANIYVNSVDSGRSIDLNYLSAGEEIGVGASVNSIRRDNMMIIDDNVIKLIVDNSNNIDESDETNNEISITFNLAESDVFCNDGTRMGECSDNLPMFCNSINSWGDVGELIELSSLCGCPVGFTAEYDYCIEDELEENQNNQENISEQNDELEQDNNEQEENDNQEHDCNYYYWFDDSSTECDYKQFCGAYSYNDLRTFDELKFCETSLNSQNKEKEQQENTNNTIGLISAKQIKPETLPGIQEIETISILQTIVTYIKQILSYVF
jgi:hypothetical protein